MTRMSLTNPDQSLSEEQTYRDTMRGIRSYMGWTHIPDIDSSATTSNGNAIAGPKVQTPGKVMVQMPTDDWLCRKFSKLNLTLVEGYPSHSFEAGGLLKDQFVQSVKSQAKWYRLYSDQKADSTAVSSWNTDACRMNSTYLRIAGQYRLKPTSVTSISGKSAKVG